MNHEIKITYKDKLRIENLMNKTTNGSFDDLELELDRAKIIYDNEVSDNLVTMNSKIVIIDKETYKKSTITLVYPSDADIKKGQISVFAPLGSAVLGLSVGQEIQWTFPNGKVKCIKVAEILYQPEASGDWYL